MPRNTDFVAPRDTLILGNDLWEDDRVSDIDFQERLGDDTLDPGESVTALEIVSNERDISLAVHALATSRHPGDINDDGSTENIVRYRIEDRPDDPTDTYNVLPGLSTTAPFGEIGDPVSLLDDGTAVGPLYSFRVVVENRSNEFANPIAVNTRDIGVMAHARVLRGTAVANVDTNPYGRNMGVDNGGDN